MKQGIKKKTSQELLKMSLQRSLKIIDIRPEMIRYYDTAKELRIQNLSQKSLGRPARTCNNSVSAEKKSGAVSEREQGGGSVIRKKILDPELIKQIEVERKQKLLKDTENYLKKYELAIKKKEKELFHKSREFRIQSAGCQRMLAEGISKTILDDIIWTVIFKSLTQESFSLYSRKQACISAFTKMKSCVNKLECLKRDLEKSALTLISQRQSLPIPQKK